MAIYIRTRPTTGTYALGCLGYLATIGIAALYPAAFFIAAYALASLDEAMAYPDGSSAAGDAVAQAVMATLIYSFVLTGFSFGATFCFIGTDRWLAKDATVTHRDIASAQFLHISQSPNRRGMGMAWAILAGTLLVASPFLVIAVPHPLIYSESTQELVEEATWGVSLLLMVLFVALVYAAVRRRSIAVRMTPRAMSVVSQESPSLALPSSRDELGVQEAPALWGRVKVQAVYAPPTGGAEPGRPVVIPRLSLTVRPSRLDDARTRVEAQLDEVWRAAQLVRTSIEQEETADAPPSEAEPNPPHQPPHQNEDPDHDQPQTEDTPPTSRGSTT